MVTASEPTAATRCANCGVEIPWRPVLHRGAPYCCGGCAQGGPCYCSYDAAAGGETVNLAALVPIDPTHPPRMSAGMNAALVRRFFAAVLAAGDEGAVDELIAPGAVVALPTGRFTFERG
jgi:hypothetical protein